jgi:PAS domain S-box-containing protein/putative nucleotidyltransferase with HDIG domain
MMMDDSIHILLIEDDPAHAELIQRAFEDALQKKTGSHLQLVVTHTLNEAREYLQHHKPTLIIADWRLPDGDSKTVLEEQGALRTPVIVMTSYGSERNAVEAMKSGALDYIIKSSESMMDMPHIAEGAIERWQTQVALAERDRQFRLLAENSTDVISRHDSDGNFLYVSPACQTIIGYDPDELIGQDVLSLVHPDDAEDLLKLFRSSRVTDRTMAIPFRARRKNGEYIWLETTARIIYGQEQDTVEIQASSRDITERKQAQVALQRAHTDLQEAYDKTIEGWVLALDLRDRETEGHTQRVTEMTLKLARDLGCTEEEIVHIRRGALLHDIGKMGVPDKLLQKPGPLTEEEWLEMRKHPEYAYQMLSKISYLHQALIIPYYHHERWDGSGYPHKLAGEDIPLFARLFAVVDVWDALSSDRPYRRRMPPKDVMEYLRNESGRLFDPFIVEKFLQLVQVK